MKRSAPLRRTGFGRRGDSRPSSLHNLANKPRSRLKRKAPDWMTPEIAAKIRSEPVCRHCGFVGVDPHHAVPRSQSRAGRSDPRNIIPLCRADHDAWHAGAPLPRSIFTAEEWAFIETLKGPGWLGRRYPRSQEAP